MQNTDESIQSVAEFPATASQRRFWFLHELDPTSVASNIAVHWDLYGVCPSEILEDAFRRIIERHEILRTRFVEREGELFQQVVPETPFRLSTIDLRTIPAEEHESRIAGVASELSGRPFDLSQPGHLRVALVRSRPEKTSILIAAHHAIFDGFSIRVLGAELGTIAAALLAGREPDLPELPLQYGDYAQWQEACEANGALDQSGAYWQRQLADMPYFNLPYDRPTEPLAQRPGGRLDVPLHEDFQERMEAAAGDFGTSAFCIGSAVAAAVLHRVTGASDVSFATTFAGRGEADLEPLIGVFINPVVLRMQLQGETSLQSVVRQSAETVRHALSHGDYPFNRLVSDLNLPRDATRTPLVSVLFSLQPVFLQEQTYGSLRLESIPSRTPAITHDIAINVTGRDAGWMMMIDYDVNRFDRRTIEAIGELMRETFEAVFHQPGLIVADLPFTQRQEAARRPVVRVTAPTPAELIHDELAPTDLALAELSPMELAPVELVPAVSLAAEPQSAAAQAEAAQVEDALIQRLGNIWSGLLGRAPEDCDGDFFDLGGHSLLGLRMLAQVGAEFGVRPSIADFLQNSSLRAFALRLSDLMHPEEEACAAEADNGLNLIWLQEGEPDAPLILSLNQPFLYGNLARHLDSRIACANLHISDPELLRARTPDCLDRLIQLATSQIRAVAADRPVALLGQCIDGILAYRIAQNLAQSGHPVETLAMIDSWRPRRLPEAGKAKRLFKRLSAKSRRFSNYGAQFLQGRLSWEEFKSKSSWGKSMLIRSGRLSPPTEGETQEWEINGHLRVLMSKEEDLPYDSEAVLFSTASQTLRAQTERFGWIDYLPADVPVYPLEGWHEDALLKNGTARIAEVLQTRLLRASNGTGVPQVSGRSQIRRALA